MHKYWCALSRYFVLLIILPVGLCYAGEPVEYQGNPQIAAAARLASLTNALEQQSRVAIELGNGLRQLTQSRRASAVGDVDNKLLRDWVTLSREIQALAAQWRAGVPSHRQVIETASISGFQSLWPERVRVVTALTGVGTGGVAEDGTMAHNMRVRSEDPAMPETSSFEVSSREDMTLRLTEASRQRVPAQLNTGCFTISRSGQYLAHIEVDDATDAGIVPMNTLHAWRLFIVSADGKPAEGIVPVFTGHMPGHVHGLPTQPQIKGTSRAGEYRIEGVKFQMPGWWVIDLKIEQGDDGEDNLRFNLRL